MYVALLKSCLCSQCSQSTGLRNLYVAAWSSGTIQHLDRQLLLSSYAISTSSANQAQVCTNSWTCKYPEHASVMECAEWLKPRRKNLYTSLTPLQQDDINRRSALSDGVMEIKRGASLNDCIHKRYRLHPCQQCKDTSVLVSLFEIIVDDHHQPCAASCLSCCCFSVSTNP